jgi:quinol monooxygenase YgiN
MSVLILLEVNTKPGQANELTNWLRDELHHTRGSDGCNGLTVHTNQDDPNNVLIVESWDSRAQYEKYLSWRAERGDIEKMGAWVAGPPSIRYFDGVGI